MKSSLEQAGEQIQARLAVEPGGVFTEARLHGLLEEHREAWKIAQSIGGARFINFALENLSLREVELTSEEYRRFRRYAWGEYSPYLMALSLRPRSYLSHGSAVALLGLNDQLPKTIYANQEQSAKPSGGTLTQERVNRAFSHRQRVSNYVYSMDSYRVVLLSGKQSGNFGVVTATGPQGEPLAVTGVARTLVDIVVRPAYSGGIFQVLEAYRGARGRFEVAEIIQALQHLNYTYPYHQAIGFLMERAGYPSHECEPLRELGMSCDFYLIHGMKSPSHEPKWRLFFPQGL